MRDLNQVVVRALRWLLFYSVQLWRSIAVGAKIYYL